jgi:predicted transcriptional regulator
MSIKDRFKPDTRTEYQKIMCEIDNKRIKNSFSLMKRIIEIEKSRKKILSIEEYKLKKD